MDRRSRIARKAAAPQSDPGPSDRRVARHGVETLFIKAPHAGTPEDQLMLQFQGMIAANGQILERSRCGKRHRAKAGEVSVRGGVPYGYRYIRKTPETPAHYEIDAARRQWCG